MGKKAAPSNDNAAREDLTVENMHPHLPDDFDAGDEEAELAAAIAASQQGSLDDEEEEEEEPSTKKPTKRRAPKEKEEEEESDEEDDDEGDEESDEEDEDEEEDEDDKASKRTIPYQRFSKVNQRRREAEERARVLQEKLDKLTSTESDRQRESVERAEAEMDELYEKVEEARLKGDTKEAARLQRELDQKRDALTTRQSAHIALKQSLKAQETTAYNAMVEQLAALDPRFDKDADDYDEDLIAEVSGLVTSFERDGQPLPQALRRAVKYATGEDVLNPKRSLKREAPPAERKTDVKAKIKAAKRIPDDLSDSSVERSRQQSDVKALLKSGELDKMDEAALDKLIDNLAGDGRSARGGQYSTSSGKSKKR